MRVGTCIAGVVLAVLSGCPALLGSAPAGAAAQVVIRVGGPSAPGEVKIAVVGSSTDLAGQPFSIHDASGHQVSAGTLRPAVGDPSPFAYAETADLSSVSAAGTYDVVVGTETSTPWLVQPAGSAADVVAMLNLFNANADGNEVSGYHGPAHLNDASALLVDTLALGKRYDLRGGWMDAGDMVKSTAGIAYAVLLLEQAAAVDPAHAGALRASAELGLRYLLKTHPAPGVWIGQVGDADIDHNTNAGPFDQSPNPAFRRPELDDTRTVDVYGNAVSDLIRHRHAHQTTDASFAGKVAAALAFASRFEPNGATLLAAAKAWYTYAAGHLGAARRYNSKIIYSGDSQALDDVGLAGAALYNATGTSTYLTQALPRLQRSAVGAGPDFADTDPYGEAILCGAFGGHLPSGTVSDTASSRGKACALLGTAALVAQARAADTAFATPGEFVWGHDCRSAANAAVALLAGRAGAGLTDAAANSVGARARDYLVGLNPWGMSFLVGDARGVQNPHHWTATRGAGQPVGELVGGPASAQTFADQGIAVPSGPFDSSLAGYSDNADDYVTNEGSIECQAEGVLLFAALRGSANLMFDLDTVLAARTCPALDGRRFVTPLARHWRSTSGASGGAVASAGPPWLRQRW